MFMCLRMRGSLLTYDVVKAVFVVVAFAPHNMQIAIMRLAQLLLLIDRFCTISPSSDDGKNILQNRGEQIWQQTERGVQLISSSPVYAKEGLNISAWKQLRGRPKMTTEQSATLLRCCLFGASKVWRICLCLQPLNYHLKRAWHCVMAGVFRG